MSQSIDRVAARLVGVERRLAGLSSAPQLAYSSIEDGAVDEYDANGALVGVVGKQFDGSHMAASLSGPVPPTPNAASAVGGAGALTITWDGTFVGGITVTAPMDYSRCEVHVSPVPGFDAVSAEYLAGNIESPRGGTVTLAPEAGTWYVALVARSLSGKRSPRSVIVSAVVSLPADRAAIDAAFQQFDADMAVLDGNLAANTTALGAAQGRLDTAENTLNVTFPARFDAVDATTTALQSRIDAAVASGQSIIGNGDFELGNEGWGTNTTTAFTQTSATARSGSKVMFLNPTTGNVYPVSGYVPSGKGKTFYMEAYFRKIGTASASTDRVGFFPQTNTAANGFSSAIIGFTNASTLSTTAWTKVSASHTIPDTVDAVRTRFGPWAEMSANDYEVDNLVVVDVTAATDALAAAKLDASTKDAVIAQQASTAQTAADNAGTAAQGAQTTADSAKADAATASGIAGGKADVLIQTSAPAAAMQKATTLWIDTTSGANTPKRWSGTAWVVVTDKKATDAAAAAATADGKAVTAQNAANTAQARADAAHALAGTAKDTADSALTAAGRTTAVTYSTAPPAGVGGKVGDTHRQQVSTTNKDIKAEWYWDGSSWVPQLITTDAISNLDVGKLSAGSAIIVDVVAQKIAAASGQYIELDVKQLNVTDSALIKTGVAESFFTKYFVTNRLSANQVLIGRGSNSLVDEFFEDETVKAARHTLASSWGGWGRDTTTNLNWYGGSLPGITARSFHFETITSYDKGTYIPVRPGEKYRFRAKYTSTAGGPRATVKAINNAGGLIYSASGFTTSAGGSNVYEPTGSLADIDRIFTVPADIAYIMPALQFNQACTSAYVYGGADFRSMTDATLAVDGLIDGKIVNGAILRTSASGARIELNGSTGRLFATRANGAEYFSVSEAGGLTLDGPESTITGATYRTELTANRGLKLNTAGLMAYNSIGEVTAEINSGSGLGRFVGRITTATATTSGTSLLPSSDAVNLKTSGLFISRTAVLEGGVTAGVWVGDTTVATTQEINVRGWEGGGVNLIGRNVEIKTAGARVGNFGNWALGDGAVTTAGFVENYLPALKILGQFAVAGHATTSQASNTHISSGAGEEFGRIYRSTSSIRYKADVQDYAPDFRALQLRPRTWVDRNPIDESDPFHRYTGYIAEEVVEIMPEFVTLNEFGEPDSVDYDRLPSPATLAILRDFERRLSGAGF